MCIRDRLWNSHGVFETAVLFLCLIAPPAGGGAAGLALRHAVPALQRDRGLALAAVGQNGDALEFCDDELRADQKAPRSFTPAACCAALFDPIDS